MKIALIGASGNAGTRLTNELVSRGHQVTAIARNADRIEKRDGVTPRSADVADADGLAEAIKGHDVVISSVRFQDTDAEKLIGAVRKSGVPRYLVVGGAASLYSPGTTQRLIDAPDFPDFIKVEATPGAHFLDLLKQEKELDWTFLSPSMMFVPGERTGRFRLGKDELLVAEDGKSSISFEDFAIAMADEIENPQHSRQRFTVGY